MRELTYVDILKNKVDTISQYHILDYLKKNLEISEFKIYLIDDDNIKVVDKNDDSLIFTFDKSTKEVSHYEQLLELEIEIGI